jgi:hypothetical chaperone protein
LKTLSPAFCAISAKKLNSSLVPAFDPLWLAAPYILWELKLKLMTIVGAETEADDNYTGSRLKAAFQLAGYESVEFELEPVAAAHYYESTLDHDELILIGDFGGGTSDFSLVRVGPSIRKKGRSPADLLGNAGLGLAGDAFDAKIIKHLVSPALGAGSSIRSMHKILPVPGWVYAKLERWHHLSLLRTKDVMDMLKSTHAQALEPEKIAALMHLRRPWIPVASLRAKDQV